jgi:hypothetical protein|tara:strand:+ start:5225 stop:5962 length:738 start_codon:yes stop_codon:yes gene_type:complete
MGFNERTPFYLISVIFLFITIILSLITTFSINSNGNDFFPLGGVYNSINIIDDSFVDKLCWYFSQLTHHTLFLLFSYFFMALLNIKSVKFFKMIGPLALTISVLYFYFLYPKQKLKIHQLSFYNFFSHFMIIFLVFCEFMYIDTYEFHETTNCFVFIISSILCIYINYFLRGVWSYDMIHLNSFKGWKLVSETTLIMYVFSLMFYILKYKNHDYYGLNNIVFKDCFYVLSGLINIIFVLIFTHYN